MYKPIKPHLESSRVEKQNPFLKFCCGYWSSLGIALGAGLYEAEIVFPQWLVALPESGYQWNAERACQANTRLAWLAALKAFSLVYERAARQT